MGQQVYRRNPVAGQNGQVVEKISIATRVNNAPRTAQVATYTADSATNATEYTVTINSVDISFTSDASATTGEMAIGIAAAINAENLVNGAVIATVSTNDVIVTSRTAGIAFTATEAESELSLVQTTANDEADPVSFGVLCVGDSTSSTRARAVEESVMTAQAVTLTPAALNEAVYPVGVTVGGVTYDIFYIADSSTSVSEITAGVVALVNAAVPASSVLATDNSTSLTLSAEVAGTPFSFSFGGSSASGLWTASSDNQSNSLTDVNRCAEGVSIHTLEYPLNASGDGEYPKNSPMALLRRGTLYVTTEESINPTMDVWVGVDSTDATLWRGSVGTTVANWVRLDRSKFSWDQNISSTLAVLRVNL